MKNHIKLTMIFLILIFIGCGKDDDSNIEDVVEISLGDLNNSIRENSPTATLLGTFSAIVENTEETATYTLLSQSPEGAVRLNGNALVIANNALYDFETITEVTGQIQASVDDVTTIANFTISLTNVEEFVVSSLKNSQDERVFFRTPSGMVQDQQGNIFVVEIFNHSISKISTDGSITSLAGNGNSGFSDGRGVAASFNFPNGLAIDNDGNLYVADEGNHRIRKVTPDGDVTTFAGTGEEGFKDGEGNIALFSSPNSIVWSAKHEAFFVTEIGNNTIRSVSLEGKVNLVAGKPGEENEDYKDGVGEIARFNSPNGICVNELGDLFVADTGNDAIRSITFDNEGATVSTFAGSTVNNAAFDSPKGVAIDGNGTLYIADTDNHLIKRVENREVTTIAGDGTEGIEDGIGLEATFRRPQNLMITNTGLIYTNSFNNMRIIEIQ